jgi:hypothetical protein
MAGKTSLSPKRPKRHKRTQAATAVTRELLLLGVDVDTIATKVALPPEAFRRLYRPEIDQFGASGHSSHVPTAQSLKQAKYCGSIGLSDADIRRVLSVSAEVYNSSYRENRGRRPGPGTVGRLQGDVPQGHEGIRQDAERRRQHLLAEGACELERDRRRGSERARWRSHSVTACRRYTAAQSHDRRMKWLIVFGIVMSDGQVVRKNPEVEYPTELSCLSQGLSTFLDWRGSDAWAFFECQKQPN